VVGVQCWDFTYSCDVGLGRQLVWGERWGGEDQAVGLATVTGRMWARDWGDVAEGMHDAF
jgi:hypothetical protein